MHPRNEKRAQELLEGVPGAEDVLTGDLASIEETKQLAANANALGCFDAKIHNARDRPGFRRRDFSCKHIGSLHPVLLHAKAATPDFSWLGYVIAG